MKLVTSSILLFIILYLEGTQLLQAAKKCRKGKCRSPITGKCEPRVECTVAPCSNNNGGCSDSELCEDNYCGGCHGVCSPNPGCALIRCAAGYHCCNDAEGGATCCPDAAGACPPAEGPGICVELCSSNDDCSNGQLCCSNGCGHVCTDPALVCPPPGIGTCVEECKSDDDCSNDQLCCSNGCGHVCTNGVQAAHSVPLESALIESVQSGGYEIQIKESWVMAIGGLLAVLLFCNMVFMCHKIYNTKNGKGYYVVKQNYDDSEA